MCKFAARLVKVPLIGTLTTTHQKTNPYDDNDVIDRYKSQ